MRRVTSFLLLALSGILLFFAVTGPHGLLHLRAVDREIDLMAEKNRELDTEIHSLQNQIYGVQKSDHVLEEHAREQLGLSKPGEIVYILPGTVSAASGAGNTAPTTVNMGPAAVNTGPTAVNTAQNSAAQGRAALSQTGNSRTGPSQSVRSQAKGAKNAGADR